MTPQEFKAWFEGFTEAFTSTPTKGQWARVKERVAEIDGKPVTERIFIDHYWPSYQRYYWTNVNYSTTPSVFNSTSAMTALGKVEYQASLTDLTRVHLGRTSLAGIS